MNIGFVGLGAMGAGIVPRLMAAGHAVTGWNRSKQKAEPLMAAGMRLAESQAAKPLHIKIVTVAPGDTVERLASRIAVPDRPVERFRVLNGLGPNDHANPGDQVKIVVE